MLQDHYRTGLGQDSHAFLPPSVDKLCRIGGIVFPDVPGLAADSDGDPVLHAICNAISSITHIPILGGCAQAMCLEEQITDSSAYLEVALSHLSPREILHVALCLEGKRPRMQSSAGKIRQNVAYLLAVPIEYVGLTITSGDGLSAFGRGEGIQCFCSMTVRERARDSLK
ncbi:MAG: 2-C-methyl-D-erythritol 2,4-cyclodiphosphate synthase [Chlamydiota bacterium]